MPLYSSNIKDLSPQDCLDLYNLSAIEVASINMKDDLFTNENYVAIFYNEIPIFLLGEVSNSNNFIKANRLISNSSFIATLNHVLGADEKPTAGIAIHALAFKTSTCIKNRVNNELYAILPIKENVAKTLGTLICIDPTLSALFSS